MEMGIIGRYYIGIDPDVDKSGYAVISHSGNVERLGCLHFAELIDFVSLFAQSHENVVVCIEAGWLNHTNWHIAHANIATAARIGNATGRNHQTGILLCEMLTHIGIDTRQVKPLRKCWQGHDRKITHNEIASFANIGRNTTNQEERDALLLAWVSAGLPIRISRAKSKQNKDI